MIQVDNKWIAQEGYLFIRKSDDKTMGDTLFLGEGDSIDNYEERPFSKQERDEFEKEYSFGGNAERIPRESIDDGFGG